MAHDFTVVLKHDSCTFDQVLQFALVMEEKLQKNLNKGGPEGWRFCSPVNLLLKLRGEMTELEIKIEERADPNEVAKEAADVANYAMMIAESYRERSTRFVPSATI